MTPEDGVTRYKDDPTQGPACAIAAGAATIYRNYFVPIGDAAAVVHFWSRLRSGAAHPAGAHAVDTLILAVLTYQGDAWKIVSHHVSRVESH